MVRTTGEVRTPDTAPGRELSRDEFTIGVAALPSKHQPRWHSSRRLTVVRGRLHDLQPLVRREEVRLLHEQLALASEGKGVVLQAGDCAEPCADSQPTVMSRKARALTDLAAALSSLVARPVVPIGRLAGQYAKPRSADTEVIDGLEISTYRGDLINDWVGSPEARRHDPLRLLYGHRAAARAVDGLEETIRAGALFISHEALVLDYELAMVAPTDDGLLLTSAHVPWVGYRTNHPAEAHIALLAGIVNPVAMKIGPHTTSRLAVRAAATLDPHRVPGRLTLIARMGAGHPPESLATVMRATRDAGHPIVWLCDPMHGNTTTHHDGRKVRYLDDILSEVRAFHAACRVAGVPPAGLHLETTIDDVQECLTGSRVPRSVEAPYTTRCDPRLTHDQALLVVDCWAAELRDGSAHGPEPRG